MAITHKTSFKLPFIDRINMLKNSKSISNKIGQLTVDEIQVLIARGESPVAKSKRFVGYKADRSGDRKNPRFYPTSIRKKFPNKTYRPVNLSLNNSFLSKLGHKRVRGINTEIGMFGVTAKQRLMFETHNEGTHKFVPQRRFLPTTKNEKLKRSIVENIKDLLEQLIKRELKIR